MVCFWTISDHFCTVSFCLFLFGMVVVIKIVTFAVVIVVGAIAIFVIMSFFSGPAVVETPDVSSIPE